MHTFTRERVRSGAGAVDSLLSNPLPQTGLTPLLPPGYLGWTSPRPPNHETLTSNGAQPSPPDTLEKQPRETTQQHSLMRSLLCLLHNTLRGGPNTSPTKISSQPYFTVRNVDAAGGAVQTRAPLLYVKGCTSSIWQKKGGKKQRHQKPQNTSHHQSGTGRISRGSEGTFAVARQKSSMLRYNRHPYP